jgi:hypothetical protein
MAPLKTCLIAAALALPAAAHAQTAAKPAPVPAGPPQWAFKEATDAATGKRSATASIRSANRNGWLIVRCDTVAMPIISVQFIPRPPIPASYTRMVTITFDEAKSEIGAWEFPGAGAYIGEAADVFVLASRIATARTIRFETINVDGSPIRSTFTGPGNDGMFRKVYETCGLPYAAPSTNS